MSGVFYIDKDRLVARFQTVHAHAQTELMFQRTLRVPDDGKEYPLPVGHGHFPLCHLDDFAAYLPAGWADRGGVIMPMRRGDAMWIAFDVHDIAYPCAIKVGAGRINVLSGRRWTERLTAAKQDYIVTPPQAALDGFRTRKTDVVRQFVTVPLGAGYSVEEQIAGKGRLGGIQIVIHPMKAERYEELRAEYAAKHGDAGVDWPPWAPPGSHAFAEPGEASPTALSLAVGGRIRERIAKDPYGGIESWDQSARTRCMISLVDAEELISASGIPLPLPRPFTAADYKSENLPWFAYDGEGVEPLGAEADVPEIESIREINAAHGLPTLEADDPIDPSEVRPLRLVRPPCRTRHQSPIVRAYWTVHNLFGR